MGASSRLHTLSTKVSQRFASLTALQAAWFVLIVSIIERLLLWLIYAPVVYSDTLTYRRLAEQILLGWPNYDGTRVPGYPLTLAVLGEDGCVYLAQLILGVLITFLLFYIAWRISSKAWFAALVALAHTLNLGQLLFEANLLTETISTFLVVAALAGVIHGLYLPAARRPWLAFLIGAAAGLEILYRPNFVYLPFWLFGWIVVAWQPEEPPIWRKGKLRAWLGEWVRLIWRFIRRQWLVLSALTLPVVCLVLGWMGFIHRTYGDWALSTMTGYHLVQHTGSFFEYVPDEYAELRDTYLRYRDERIARSGTQANTIWEAIPAMQEAAGLNFYDLSRILARISLQLIREHPVLFLRSVAEGWWLFWRVPVYWSPEALHPVLQELPGVVGVIKAVILLQRLGMFAANLFFIFTPLVLVIQRRWGYSPSSDGERSRWTWIGLLGAVWLASVVQAFLDHGDNPRFLVPLQSVVVVWFLYWMWQVGYPGLRALRVKSR